MRAAAGCRWNEGGQETWLLHGRCEIRQGASRATADEAVVWIELGRYGERRTLATVYLEGNVSLGSTPDGRVSNIGQASWLGTFYSAAPVEVQVANPGPEPALKPDIYGRALARRVPLPKTEVQPVQFLGTENAPPVEPLPPGTRRIRIGPRGDVAPNASWFTNPAGTEGTAVIDGGVQIFVDGLDALGSIDVQADRVVVWTAAVQPDLQGETEQSEDTPLEFYLEGDLVFRQGDRVIYAERMYYNVNERRGIVLDAEILTPVRSYQGMLRLRAAVVQQLGEGRFLAQDAFLTSSRLGQPTYRMQSERIFYEDNERPAFNPFTGQPEIDPVTGEPLVEHNRLATSTNNFLRLGEFPIFYWPVLATDLNDPTYYIKRVQINNDYIFGTQVLADFNAYHLLGLDPIPGTDLTGRLGYLSKRGLAGGASFKYDRTDLFGIPGGYGGFINAWGLHDSGLDNLGSDRRKLGLETDNRYRILAQHRQQLPGDWQLSAEFGKISDRNFLEQYFESEYDNLKDQSTGLELKKIYDSSSFSVTADVRLNDFFMETEWLPRVDHFSLGQSWFGDRLTWYEHSQVGFGRLRQARPPLPPDMEDKFTLLPGEANVEGERLVTRQEIDLPFDIGPVKLVPYALGELAHWGEDLTGDDLQRAYGQIGLRSSIPFWNAYPEIESPLFNVHGLAHKVVFDAEYLFAESNRDLTQLPLYDNLDDNDIEQFRRRFSFNTFGGPPVPLQVDELFYALRTNLAGNVTSPSVEIADDLQELKFGVRQRWQTKRGLPGERRIVDWIVFDTQAVFFPNASRDNFGSQFGLLEYDFRWHLGDKTTLVSNGGFDFFDLGQSIFSAGVFLNRPPRMGFYLGYYSLQGPIDSQLITASASYRFTPKWMGSVTTRIALSGNTNVGQTLALTRIGESFLTTFNFYNNVSQGNVGINFMVEPRFIPGLGSFSVSGNPQVGGARGAQIPPAGAYGLE